jgi:hypothetical protein
MQSLYKFWSLIMNYIKHFYKYYVIFAVSSYCYLKNIPLLEWILPTLCVIAIGVRIIVNSMPKDKLKEIREQILATADAQNLNIYYYYFFNYSVLVLYAAILIYAESYTIASLYILTTIVMMYNIHSVESPNKES